MVTIDTEKISLIPGTPTAPGFPLARYRPTDLRGVAGEFAETATQPGDVVLVLGASCGAIVREIAEAGRRAVALYRSPVDRLCAETEIRTCPHEDLQAALSRLADQRKGGRPLYLHVRDLYSTTCPRCHLPGVAEWFAWDRDSGRPFAKSVPCDHCQTTVQGPVTDEDLATSGVFPPAGGPAFHLALSRAREHSGVVAGDEIHRVTQLIQLYTSRNLSILMDIVNRLPQLRLPERVASSFAALLLETFDLASTLTAYEMTGGRPRSLRPPQKFLERNVWMVLEHALSAFEPAVAGRDPGARHFHALEPLLASSEPGYLLRNSSIQDLDPTALGGAFDAAVLAMAPPDAVSWALTTLWAIWLWGDRVPAGLARFLRRRRLDWEWYRRGLTFAINRLRPLLAPGAPILMSSAWTDPAAARAAIHAATETGLATHRWLVCPPYGFRLVGTVEPAGPAPAPSKDVAEDSHTIERLLELRGEPAGGSEVVTAAIIETGNADIARFDQLIGLVGNVEPITDDQLWLRDARRARPPLADRVEEALLERLTQAPPPTRAEVDRALYPRFHGICTPAAELVKVVLKAYTVEDGESRLWLRPEDDAQRRSDEIRGLRRALQELGERLGYRIVRRIGRDLVWRDNAQVAYLFRFSSTAELGSHLLGEQPTCDGRRCLIVPGGRSALIALKLRRDPRLVQRSVDHRWTFIKFRHLRRMVQEITQRAEIEVFLGLDPIVEQSGAQIPMPLGLESA